MTAPVLHCEAMPVASRQKCGAVARVLVYGKVPDHPSTPLLLCEDCAGPMPDIEYAVQEQDGILVAYWLGFDVASCPTCGSKESLGITASQSTGFRLPMTCCDCMAAPVGFGEAPADVIASWNAVATDVRRGVDPACKGTVSCRCVDCGEGRRATGA